MSALALMLAAASLFLTAVKWTNVDIRTQRAVCAVVDYAEAQADTIRAGGSARPRVLRAAAGLDKLASDMRHTGIHCPPRRHTFP